jgi:prepilin-type N-terminal cleavage/methylation domain-containing protein
VRRRGFTLVELLIVIIIIAVLAAIAIPKIANSSQRAHESELRAKLKVVRDAVERFKHDMNGLPLNLAVLARSRAPATIINEQGNIVAVGSSAQFSGPYIDATTAAVNPAGNGLLDPICGGTFGYSVSGLLDYKVSPCAQGTASDGTNMATW